MNCESGFIAGDMHLFVPEWLRPGFDRFTLGRRLLMYAPVLAAGAWVCACQEPRTPTPEP
jgi:hypothetical protein